MATLVKHWWNESVIESTEWGYISYSMQVFQKRDCVVVSLREDGAPLDVSFRMRGEPVSTVELRGKTAWVTRAPPETVEIEVSRDATQEHASLRLVRKS